jgi:hypothetical protein
MKTAQEIIMDFFPTTTFGVEELAKVAQLTPLLHSYGEEVKKELAEYFRDSVVSVSGVKTHVGDQIAGEILAYKLK